MGESGPHEPDLAEKWTQPPKAYTEATLLRAMETAGKLVEDEALRDALKENGIGRPSTRAAIIETLFKRRYIRKERKNLIATPTGVQLIETIHQDLLKSAELTGMWEKKLWGIEKREYDTRQFLEELKQMVSEVVMNVIRDNRNHQIEIVDPAPEKTGKKKAPQTKTTKKGKKKAAEETEESSAKPERKEEASFPCAEGNPCPLCKAGKIIKGKTAYGCSRWKEGCEWRVAYEL